MCLVCSQWQLGKLSNKEALSNLGEMIVSGGKTDHYYEVVDKIMEKELGSSVSNDEMDLAWHKENLGG